jgi:hypothetical protein
MRRNDRLIDFGNAQSHKTAAAPGAIVAHTALKAGRIRNIPFPIGPYVAAPHIVGGDID